MTIDQYEKTSFTFDGKTRDVFRRGTGPAVIVIAEMPGHHPRCRSKFADGLSTSDARRCCRICSVMPGRAMTAGYAMSSMLLPACVSPRLHACWATGRTSLP